MNFNLKQKQIKKLIIYMIPVIALTLGSILGLGDVAGLENSLTALFTAILGLLGVLGIVDNNDKETIKSTETKKSE